MFFNTAFLCIGAEKFVLQLGTPKPIMRNMVQKVRLGFRFHRAESTKRIFCDILHVSAVAQ